MSRRKHGLLEDEQGDRSFARTALVVALPFTAGLIVLDAALSFEVAPPAWALLSAVDLALIGWAAGPRIARYLLPQVGAVAQAVGSAGKRLAGVDRSRTDDERG